MNANVSKTNGVKLFALVAVLAMVFAGAAVMMSDSGVDAATSTSGKTTYLSGDVTSTQNFGDGTNVVVDGDLVIPEGMSLVISGTGKLTIDAGTTLTIEAGGQLILQGTPTVTVNGNIVAEGTSDDATYIGAIINNTTYNATDKTGVVVSGNITLEKGAELVTKAGTISNGDFSVTLNAVTTGGDIVLNNGASLDVTQSSRYVSEIGGQNILMNVGATANINGAITDAVNIQAVGTGTIYTAGAVKLTGVTSDNTPDLVFTVTSENISALTSQDAETPVTLKQYMVNIDGDLDGAAIETSGKVVGNDAYYQTSGYGYKYFPTVTVTGELTVADGGNNVVIGKETTLNVTGNVSIDYTEPEDEGTATHSAMTINGSLFVSGTVSGYSGNGITASQASTDERIVINGGTIAITLNAAAPALVAHLYGTMYTVDGGSDDDILYIQDFDDAVAGAVAAESKDVTVYAWGTHNKDYNAQDAADRGAYVITSDITIPDNLELIIQNALVVGEGATLTIAEGADVTFEGTDRDFGPAVLWVEGKVVDYDGIMGDYEGTDLATTDNGIFMYEVRKETETDSEFYVTYTTLKIALAEAQPGEVIDLNGQVTIDENMTIPEQVTVAADAEEETGIIIQNATLTVNGVLDMNDTQYSLIKDPENENSNFGVIVVNNYVEDVNFTNYDVWSTDDVSKYVDGAYFNGIVGDAEEETYYIASVSIAADASATVTDHIRIFGNVNMGDVTFTASETMTNGLKVYIYNDKDDVATAGTITIGNNVILNTYSGDLTGTVAGADSTVVVEGNKDTEFTVKTVGADEAATQQMQIASMVGNTKLATSDGSITIATGTVYVVASFQTDDMTVAEGATLVIAEEGKLIAGTNPGYRFNTTSANMPLFTEGLVANLAGLTVEGTITVEGDVETDVAYINGSIDVANSGSFTNKVVAYINGTVTGEEGAEVVYVVALLNGALAGDVSAEVIAVYPGSDVTGAEIAVAEESTAFYVNGEEAVTVYSKTGVSGELVLLMTSVNGVRYDTAKFYVDEAMTDCVTDFTSEEGVKVFDALDAVIDGFKGIVYNADADTYDYSTFTDALTSALTAGNFDVGDYEAVYIGMEPALVSGTISVGTGLNLYIDSLAWGPSNGYQLEVGTHTVSFDVSAGYDGTNATIAFNGQTVENGGTITIDADATTFTLIVSGAVPSSGQVVIDNGSGDDGLGLTDILLIVLVVLIVIMAIMVAMRLMRS